MVFSFKIYKLVSVGQGIVKFDEKSGSIQCYYIAHFTSTEPDSVLYF